MSTTYDCADEPGRSEGLAAAVDALGEGGLVVIATDTVYGLAADAFDPDAVAALLAAKGRDRTSPPPVLIGAVAALDGLAAAVPQAGRDLANAFWPGALTLVCTQQPSLRWDLGDTLGTVALRLPDHPLTRELLTRTGPLAVSSANRTGQPPATTAAQAREQLGDAVAVYLETGPSPESAASSIVDVTGDHPVLLREGALSWSELWRVAPDLVAPELPEPDPDPEPEPEPDPEPEADAEPEPEPDAEPEAGIQ